MEVVEKGLRVGVCAGARRQLVGVRLAVVVAGEAAVVVVGERVELGEVLQGVPEAGQVLSDAEGAAGGGAAKVPHLAAAHLSAVAHRRLPVAVAQRVPAAVSQR